MYNRKQNISSHRVCVSVRENVCVCVCMCVHFHFCANEFKDDCIILQQLNQAQHLAFIQLRSTPFSNHRLFASLASFVPFFFSFFVGSSPVVFLALFVRRNTLMGHLSHFLWMETRSFSR